MRRSVALSALALLLTGARPAHAAWAAAGNSVVTNGIFTFGFPTPGGGFSSMCSDGHGGLIVAFHQNAGGTPDTFKVQRMDRDGVAQWGGARGLRVGPGESFSTTTPTVLADGDGGAWVAYFIDFSGTGFALGLYAQHFDNDGNTSIAFPGVRVGGLSAGVAGQPRVAVTPSGRLVAMWIGQGSAGTTDTVRVQRVSQGGSLDFAAAGVVLGTSTQLGNDMVTQSIVADGSGLVAVWTEETNSTGPERLRANRVNASGVVQWGAQGTTVFGDPDFAVLSADAIWDGVNGLTVAFSATDQVNSGTDLFVTRLDPAGTVNASWGSTSTAEVVVGSGMDPGVRRSLRIVDDGADGCILGWVDTRNTAVVGPGGVPFRHDIRGQRYNATGTRQWTSGGVAVNIDENDQFELTMIPDAANGAHFAYQTIPGSDTPSDLTDDIQFTHVNSAGTLLWHRFHSGTAAPVASDGLQSNVMLAADGAGGVMLAWANPAGIAANHRESSGSLYTPSIVLLAPDNGESYATMQPIPVTWSSNFGGDVKLAYTINDGAPITITASTPDDGAQTWFAPILDSDLIRVRVSSVDVPSAFDESHRFITICPTVETPYTIGGPVTSPRDVESGDFDEDGIFDLAVAVSGGVGILPGNGVAGVGNATFAGSTLYATPAAANRVAIGDFDEDGILDLAVTHASGLMTFRGNGAGSVGDGTFAAGVAVAGIGRCVGVVAADLDNDGTLDLAVADSVNNRAAVFIGHSFPSGDGDGTFEPPAFYAVGSQPEGIAAADLDLDGDVDLATANFGGVSVSKLTNTGANGFGTGVFTVASVATFSGPHAIVLHDLDDDGDPDVAVANAAGISVHVNTLAGGVATLGAATNYVSLPQADLVVADPSRNGIEDIAAAGLIGTFEVYFGNGAGALGDGTFTIGGGLTTTGGTPDAITANDFNEDGRIDFVIANLSTNNLTMFTGGCLPTLSASPVVTAPNGGEILQPNTLRTISWTKSSTTTAVDVELSRDDGANWEPLATDVVGTSLTWLVALPASTKARVRVLAHGHPQRNDISNANFTICATLSNTGAAITTASGGPKDAVVADFNEDGILDLAHAVTVGIAYKRGLGAAGVGNGTFAADISHAAGAPGKNLVTADFNEDGILDLATTTTGGVAVFLGTGAGGVGNGGFGAATVFPAGADPTGIAVGDFNEDGIQDLVVSSTSTDSVFVLLGDGSNGTGNGSFPSGSRRFAGDAPGRITTGDFNEDGMLDLAIACASAGSPGVQIMLGMGAGGTGNGGFIASTRPATSGGAVDVATGDFNEDGITDLAVSSDFGISTLRGTGSLGVGNGGFAAAVVVDAVLSGGHIAVADFNRDGRADLMGIFNGIGPIKSVQLCYGKGSGATGDGSFTAAESYTTGLTLGPIVIADFDEDNEVDALIGAPTSNQYMRLLGSCSPGAATVTLSVPDGAEEWLVGQQQVISWSRSATVMGVDVEVSRDGGHNFETVARDLTANSFTWNVSGPFTQNARVRVRDSASPNVNDKSAADFLIFETSVDVPPAGLPTAIAFSAPRPNPTRGSSAFALSLPEARHVSMELFDMQGRHVRSLVRGELGAGQHTLTWDGRDDTGVRMSAGMYFARIRAGRFEATRHVVRVE